MGFNIKNKYVVHSLRVLFGLFMIFSGVSGLLMGPNAEGIPAPMVEMTRVLWETGIFQMIKVTEVITGLMLVFSFLPWLAIIALAPLAVGILVVNSRISPAYLPMGIIVALLVGYFTYVYWDKYKQLFRRK